MTASTSTKKRTAPSSDVSVEVRDLSGKKTGTVTLPACFASDAGLDVVAQAHHTALKRTRIRRAHTKERAEVRGGGRKPWKQKGTGRARHGSRRSPIWTGGGITFGPRSRKERVLPMPKGMMRRALAGALTAQATRGAVHVVKTPADVPTKTRDVAALLADDFAGALLITQTDRVGAWQRVARNIPRLMIADAATVGVGALVEAQALWIDETALEQLSRRCDSSETAR